MNGSLRSRGSRSLASLSAYPNMQILPALARKLKGLQVAPFSWRLFHGACLIAPRAWPLRYRARVVLDLFCSLSCPSGMAVTWTPRKALIHIAYLSSHLGRGPELQAVVERSYVKDDISNSAVTLQQYVLTLLLSGYTLDLDWQRALLCPWRRG
ncbi:uncharacterized protein B0H64DRAFT_650 [Chaetomium fimeti]|uniref:Uncharacterized protein n=1 Tax=Chaetomium fimeti TaxID=1854472 RepID=A0AAE0HNE4_9PEZI|nr:hypothetical protein B0H64DRAFT_650 [Chaetomium fimeti]